MDAPIAYSIDHHPGNKNKTMMVVLTVIILLALAGGGYYLYSRSQTPAETKVVVQTSPTPAATETPTPIPVDRSKVKVQVLNGTGTPGEAKKAVEALVKAGYKEENIETGNAEDYDHTSATVEFKKGMEDAAKDVEESLDSTFEKIEIETKELADSSEYDIVITTGGKIYEEPTSAPTAKPTVSSATAAPTVSTSVTPTRSPTP